MRTANEETTEFGPAYAAKQLRRRASVFRRSVRNLYISNLLKSVIGPAIDVGCGAGQVLERLPPGSMGLEVSPVLVHELTRMGLNVKLVHNYPHCVDLAGIEPSRYRTLILSHVLEHFESAHAVLSQLFVDAAELGIERVIVIVPGSVGYRSDSTHRTFITYRSVRAHEALTNTEFHLRETSYFPGNAEFLGRVFKYHELTLIFDRSAA